MNLFRNWRKELAPIKLSIGWEYIPYPKVFLMLYDVLYNFILGNIVTRAFSFKHSSLAIVLLLAWWFKVR